jgi:uncharacterized cupin superfamily protein
MPKLDLAAIPVITGSRYPAPFDEPCKTRRVQRLGAAAGLQHLGASRVVLPPGAWSSQRHWHHKDEEFVVVLEGEVVLVSDSGEETLRAGDCCAFKPGGPDGHHAQNRSDREAVLLAVSSHLEGEGADFPGIDLRVEAVGSGGAPRFVHTDGTPYSRP